MRIKGGELNWLMIEELESIQPLIKDSQQQSYRKL